MFHNWINIHDLARLKDKLSMEGWRPIRQRLFRNALGRTRSAWEHTENPPVNAWDIPALRRRWVEMVSGDAKVDHVDYICRRFLSGKKKLSAFSPGCGTGANEKRWVETGLFERIDAIDLSPARIAKATAMSEQSGLAGILKFQVKDMAWVSGESQYDLVLAEGALHHLYPMRVMLGKLERLLKPQGLLVVNDFVGPSRFQWTARQLQAANALLALIPEDYRRRWRDSRVKERIRAPGRLRMRLADPSEAAESSLILPLLKEMFTTLELKNKGGALIPLVFFEIAHHYIHPDETATAILRNCFAAEDLLLRRGEIASDYILGVFQKTRAHE
jgi:SAM-dependent methyltransferase